MISSPLKVRFESVLDEQHLIDDLSIFAARNYFDEVPLFSRYQQVEFLCQYGDANLLLVELALDYLDRVIAAMPADDIKRFIAITIISDDGGEHLVPHIFVCSGELDRRLASLRLAEPTDRLGEQVQELVNLARPKGSFSVSEDRSTVAGDVRIFVGHVRPPQGFLGIEELTDKTRHQP